MKKHGLTMDQIGASSLSTRPTKFYCEVPKNAMRHWDWNELLGAINRSSDFKFDRGRVWSHDKRSLEKLSLLMVMMSRQVRLREAERQKKVQEEREKLRRARRKKAFEDGVKTGLGVVFGIVAGVLLLVVIPALF